MKKIISVLSIILCLACLSVNCFAYKFTMENSYSLELPDDYTQVGESQFISDDDSNLNISVSQKEDKDYCIEDMSNEQLLTAAQEEAKTATAAFAALGKKGGMEVVSCEKTEHPTGKVACVTVYKTFMEKDGKQVSHLQKTYLFSCENNDYTFVYTPEHDKDIDALDNTFNSIIIEEPDAESTRDKLVGAIPPAIIVLLILFGIFKFIRGRKR